MTFTIFTFAGKKLRRKLRKVPLSSLADAVEGSPVRVEGIVRELEPPLEPLVSPLEGTACVYYATCVDIDKAGALFMTPHVRESRGRRFALDDGHQLAIVDPTHALVSSRYDRESTTVARYDANPRQRALIDKGPEPTWFTVIRLHYYESIIETGQRIALLGAGIREPSPIGGSAYRDAAMRMHFAGTVANPLVICDHPDQL
jgi:hypothetical protein